MSSPLLIDDTNPIVQYQPGWIWDQLVDNAVGNTRHGAALANITASLGFTGTGIEVVGTLEPTDVSGRPTTSYSIDGTAVGTYTAPFTARGDTQVNVTFFSKRNLSPGNHQIVVTNVNGSDPNTFWLDYFLVYSSGASSETASSTSSSSRTAPSRDASGTPIAGGNTGDSNSAPATSTNVGAIVGGVIGGVALILLSAILLMMLRRRRTRSNGAVQPFVHAGPVTPSSPSTKSGGAPTVLASQSSTPVLSSYPASSAPPSSYHGELPEMRYSASAVAPPPPMSVTGVPTSATILTPSINAAAPSVAPSETGGPPSIRAHAEVSRAPWYAPAEGQSRARSLLHAFSIRNRPKAPQAPMRDVDSGLRLYNEPALPPACTPD